MGKVAKRRISKDRNLKTKPWKPLIPFAVPPEGTTTGVVAAFQNHILTIFVKETDAPAFLDPEGKPTKVAHLIIMWSDKSRKDEINYRYLQRAKSELCGSQADAVQLYPAAWREENFSSVHLWVLPQGAAFPIGIVPRDIESKMAEMVGGRENVVMKEDLELFVVKHGNGNDEMIEVFSSEDECKQIYGDNPIPETSKSGIEMIGSIPLESSTVVWTDSAKAKVGKVLAKSEAVAANQVIEEVPELFYENDNPEFDSELHDPVDASIEETGEEPSGLEEHLAIAGAMREALSNGREKRAMEMRDAAERVTQRANDNIRETIESATKPNIIITGE